MSILQQLPHKCRIQRKARSNDESGLGGSVASRVVERTNVPCWEQQAGSNEILEYDSRGMSVNRKIYFTENIPVTSRHEIVITERLGVPVPADEQVILDVMSDTRPDAGAGLMQLYKVMVNDRPGTRR